MEIQRLTWIQRFVATTLQLTNIINMERKWLAASSVMQVSAQKTSFVKVKFFVLNLGYAFMDWTLSVGSYIQI